ncbi:MAG TPA: phosphatidylcholine/phosphatidylserine synthase [Allosphingosinicella sp.]|nr:phosphatidylcholine/phosphatidylserine synthase [Allosphingosinicella sp.]
MSAAPGGRERPGIPLRAVVPNAVTALALCSGLSGIRFAITGEWDKALMFIGIAAVLDGLDGRIARMLRGQSRFGAELDSLSDVVAFGVAPALIIYLWVLQIGNSPGWNTYGWVFALAYAVCMAMRLARFNARIDVVDQPHKSAGFLTGVPAPAGAGIMLLPVMLWLASDRQWHWLESPALIMIWSGFSAFLIISSIATWSMGALRLKRSVRLEAILVIVLIGIAMIVAPWATLSVVVVAYVTSIPFSILRYARVKQRRARQATGEPTLPLSPPLAPVPPKDPARQRRQPPNAP